MRRLLCLVGLCAACVKGNPIEFGDFTGTGGRIDIPDCGYAVTTRDGAEAPKFGIEAYGDAPTPRLVHLGIVGDPKTSIVAQWRTQDETTLATTIRFAKGDNLAPDALTQTKVGVEFGFQAGGDDGMQHVYRVHQAHVCGLEPGTTYSYQVGGTDPFTHAEHYSPVYTFRTAPDITANPDTESVFGFVGDCRGGYDTWSALLQQIDDRSPDLILFSGDAVLFGITQGEWEDFFGRAEQLFSHVALISAHGNHEANAVNYYSQIAMPGDQQNYGLDWGYAHITVANDTPEDPNASAGATKDAISADFAASASARWKLFMHHQPMYSASTSHGSNLQLQQLWVPIVDQYHVDLVLNGHDHDYEVSKPMIANAPAPANPLATVYIVAGGAGATLYENGSGSWTEYSEKTYSAATIHVRRDEMRLDAFRPDGSPITPGFDKLKP